MPSEQKREKYTSQQLSLLLDMNNPDSVLEEVKTLFRDMFKNGKLSSLVAVFHDTVTLFQGNFVGYQACDTPYHNLQHTTDVFLAMARLIHGAHVAGVRFSQADISISLIAALMHDTGYVRKDSDNLSSGALLASIHVRRSVGFMTLCLTQNNFPKDQILQSEKLILCTDHENAFGKILFTSNNQTLLGNMITSADLLAQTADRTYLEKLPLLFLEFRKGGNGHYESELAFFKDSVAFNDHMHKRLVNQLDNVKRFYKNHFQVHWDLDLDLYQLAIARSMAYLKSTLLSDSNNYKSHLRRALKPIN